jgi:hypothetical protein
MSIDAVTDHVRGALVSTAEGTLFKVCRCRDPETGKSLRATCPKLRRQNGSWRPDHGRWTYQLELPPTADGNRRQLRPPPFVDRAAAEDELDAVRRLLDLPHGDKNRLVEIGDMLQQARRNGGALPDLETIRRRLRSQGSLAGVPTVAEYLPEWLQDLEVDENTRNSYACHVRLHLIPYLGEVVLDQLRPHHVQGLIRRIKERNEEILDAQPSLDSDIRKSVAGVRATGEATRHRRAQWQLAAGPKWPDTGLFFVRRDGRAWHPGLGVTTLPAADPARRLPTSPAPRPAPQRRHHRATSRSRHQGRVRTARALDHHPHPRHLPKRRQIPAPRSANAVAKREVNLPRRSRLSAGSPSTAG